MTASLSASFARARAHATEASLCLPFPMRDGRYMAQIVIPRDLTQAEADRLCAFVQTLVIPYVRG